MTSYKTVIETGLTPQQHSEAQRKLNSPAGLAGSPDPHTNEGEGGLAQNAIPEKWNSEPLPQRRR